MPKTLLIFLLPILLILNVFGQKQSSKNPKGKFRTKQLQTQIPTGWKLIDLDDFSFLLPDTMEDKQAIGDDSQVWRFEDGEMELFIDSGMYTSDFQELKESYKVREENVNINGKNVKFVTWDKSKDISETYKVNKDGSLEPHETYEKHFAIGVYFQKGKRRYSGTNFMIISKTLEAQEEAKKILYSIKFKKT